MGATYCTRCDRQFNSRQSMQQHRTSSPSHHRCSVCNFDGPTWDSLLSHHRKTSHRAVCQGCDDGKGSTWVADSKDYNDHFTKENVCRVCERHFQTPDNLAQHKVVHLEAAIECYGCYRKFTTYPAMIIHLESGSCGSEIDVLDINESAALCFQWKAYLDADYRDELLNRDDLEAEYDGTVYPFRCPECEAWFSKLSGLFQHVCSRACGQRLGEGKLGKLVRWLEKRHELGGGGDEDEDDDDDDGW